ncbi:unnamed protein product [Prunus armeniaca]|uniref:DUF3475 domain-containing protein n=1 Tax=Prunus armeniaca TaxID=36596 RepID=A0A6J5Y5V3_PRUAR|nr:unnamed protein product [Prunus armeniaca]
MSRKENTISILAFEVTNTIVKGANLMQSLSEDNVRHLKEVVLPSKGVQTLIFRDMDELLRIAAADKRIGSKVTQQKHFKRQAQADMEQLMTLVQSTAELCHELQLLDRLEQEYQHRLKEDGSNAARRGDSLAVLRADVEMQEKFILYTFNIHEAFGSADDEPVESSWSNHKKLGHLISQSGASDGGMPSTPVKTLNQKINLLSRHTPNSSFPVLTDKDQEMLQDVSKSNLRLRMSKSQNYASRNAMLSKQHRLSKSSRDCLSSKTRKDPFPIWSLLSRPIDFDNDRIKLLDVIDGVDTTKGSN